LRKLMHHQNSTIAPEALLGVALSHHGRIGERIRLLGRGIRVIVRHLLDPQPRRRTLPDYGTPPDYTLPDYNAQRNRQVVGARSCGLQ